MTGQDLRAMRLSLGLRVAQAAMLMQRNGWLETTVLRVESGDWIKYELEIYGEKLREWQAAGEKKDGEG